MVEISEAEYDKMTAVNSKAALFFLKEAGRSFERIAERFIEDSDLAHKG